MNEYISNLAEVQSVPEFTTMINDEAFKYTTDKLEIMQVNVGYLCNLACKHCHVSAGPNRTEIMSKEVIDAILTVCREQQVGTIDITGGAPEMNPNIEYFVEEATRICDHVIVRSNLVILKDEKYAHLMQFFKEHKVEIDCSLPYYRPKEMNRVRGDGSFEAAIEILQQLNELGYGRDPGLVLNMVYNPAGAFFPPDQTAMEAEYKKRLMQDYGIEFNNLFTITNNPMGRFGLFLKRTGKLDSYIKKLYDAFNPGTLEGMMCRFQLSVGYDGKLYDCDFNQAGELPISTGETIFDLVGKPFKKRRICFAKHCYACTAGAGSSCGGTTE